MLEEKPQRNPQEGLGEQVCKNTCNKNKGYRFLAPKGKSEPNCTFHDDRDKQSIDHFFLERRMRKMTKPVISPMPTRAQIHAMTIRPVGGMAVRLNCISTDKSFGLIVTVYFESNPAVLKTLL